MRLNWPRDGMVGGWFPMATLGIALILLGALLYVMPQLLAYFVAGVFFLVGAGLLAMAWQIRRRVTYRRMDSSWQVEDPPDDVGRL
jgi:hypothetical protein